MRVRLLRSIDDALTGRAIYDVTCTVPGAYAVTDNNGCPHVWLTERTRGDLWEEVPE